MIIYFYSVLLAYLLHSILYFCCFYSSKKVDVEVVVIYCMCIYIYIYICGVGLFYLSICFTVFHLYLFYVMHLGTLVFKKCFVTKML